VKRRGLVIGLACQLVIGRSCHVSLGGSGGFCQLTVELVLETMHTEQHAGRTRDPGSLVWTCGIDAHQALLDIRTELDKVIDLLAA